MSYNSYLIALTNIESCVLFITTENFNAFKDIRLHVESKFVENKKKPFQ
jgi:hypothetical protein